MIKIYLICEPFVPHSNMVSERFQNLLTSTSLFTAGCKPGTNASGAGGHL